jgi:hypothetical protein
MGKPKRFLRLGKWRFPLDKGSIRLLRRSKPFWTVLGENHVWSTICGCRSRSRRIIFTAPS